MKMYIVGTRPGASEYLKHMFLCRSICYWHSLEALWQGASNECHKKCFHGEIGKKSTIFGVLSGAMKYGLT